MTPAQRAVLAKAKKDGLKPSEQASEFLLHDVVEACLAQLRAYSVAWKTLSEKEQDASIKSLTDDLKNSVTDAIQIIISAGASAIPFKLKKLSIDGKLTVTGLVEGDHPMRHALTDKAHDKSEILLILSPRDYFEGLDTIQGEKDQKSLPIDEPAAEPKKPAAAGKRTSATTGSATSAAALAKTATTLPPKLLEDARTFLRDQQSVTVSGAQNHLKIGNVKAVAVLEELVSEGLAYIVEGSKPVQYTLVHAEPIKEQKDDLRAEPEPRVKPGLSFDGEDEGTDLAPGNKEEPSAETILTDELFGKIKAQVLKTKKVSVGALSIAFDADDEIIEQAIQRLELEGVISEENEAGMRTINAAA